MPLTFYKRGVNPKRGGTRNQNPDSNCFTLYKSSSSEELLTTKDISDHDGVCHSLSLNDVTSQALQYEVKIPNVGDLLHNATKTGKVYNVEDLCNNDDNSAVGEDNACPYFNIVENSHHELTWKPKKNSKPDAGLPNKRGQEEADTRPIVRRPTYRKKIVEEPEAHTDSKYEDCEGGESDDTSSSSVFGATFTCHRGSSDSRVVKPTGSDTSDSQLEVFASCYGPGEDGHGDGYCEYNQYVGDRNYRVDTPDEKPEQPGNVNMNVRSSSPKKSPPSAAKTKRSQDDKKPPEDKKAKPPKGPTESQGKQGKHSPSASNRGVQEEEFRSRQRLCRYVMDDIIGANNTFIGPFGVNQVTYLDYVASGRSLQCIEKYIQDHVMPTYANTHTEVSYYAQQTTLFRNEARSIIRQSVNASSDDAVIFCGSGSTSAVNKIVFALQPKKPLVLIGPYEHHSNILPWMNIKGSKVVRIRTTKDGLMDLGHLAWELKKGCSIGYRDVIGSFSAASNVTGVLVDVPAVSTLMHQHRAIVCFDYACAAPYVNIDMNPDGKGELAYIDAIFISTHKFIGGPGTPGLLVAKKHMFRHDIPHNVGGGTVQFVTRNQVHYRIEIEDREEGGTPAIIESIRAGLVFKLKETFTAKFIMTKEEEMLRKAKLVWSRSASLVILGNLNAARLPIFPILVYNNETGRFLHHDFVAMVMNDVFGLQVRSGCACAGPYGLDLMGLSEDTARKFEKLTVFTKNSKGKKNSEDVSPIFKPGFVRLNLPYFFSDETFNFVLTAVTMVADHAWKLLHLYDFDQATGRWWHRRRAGGGPEAKHLTNVSFDTGHMEVTDAVLDEDQDPPTFQSADNSFSSMSKPPNYVQILKRAQEIFTPKKTDVEKDYHVLQRRAISDHDRRWFMLPEETLDLLSGNSVRYVPPEDLPFFPGALAVKLGLSDDWVSKHRSRGGTRGMDRDHVVEVTGRTAP